MHFLEGHSEHLEYAHPFVDRITGQPDPITLGTDGIGLFEADRGRDHAILPLYAFLVTTALERRAQIAGAWKTSHR